MTFLTTDYSNLQDDSFQPLPEGDYEMVIQRVSEQSTPNGAESLELKLVVRNDLDQVPGLAETNAKYHNRVIFDNNWKRKATNQYPTENFHYYLHAVDVPEGTSIATIDEFINLLEGKPVRVFVKKEVDDYNTTDADNPVYRNNVAPWNYSRTQFPTVNHQWKDGDAPAVTVANNDMPGGMQQQQPNFNQQQADPFQQQAAPQGIDPNNPPF